LIPELNKDLMQVEVSPEMTEEIKQAKDNKKRKVKKPIPPATSVKFTFIL
jgi:hypothetical protein